MRAKKKETLLFARTVIAKRMLSYVVIIYRDYNNLRYICIVHGWFETQILFTDENFVEILKGKFGILLL
jgi:hypothetical protein